VKLQDCREAHRDYSKTASEVNRTLAFAALAVVWIFRLEQTAPTLLPRELIGPTVWSVLSLALDLFHYASSTVIWAAYTRHKEIEGIAGDEEFLAPAEINYPGNVLFWGKIICLMIAYVSLLRFLWSRL